MREPAVAGKFYSYSASGLDKMIKECFLHRLGKGSLPPEAGNKQDLVAVISPHAGYVFSGGCASHAFYEVACNSTPDTYLVLGLSHFGYPTSLSDEDFKTPLGILKCNKELVGMISSRCSIQIDRTAHKDEHSIEVLLPFLQFVKSKEMKKIKIVPLIIGQESLEGLFELGRCLRGIIEEYGKRIIILVSSDFTHSGSDYGYSPDKDVKSMDMKAIGYILSRDSDPIKKPGKGVAVKRNTKDLYDYHQSTGITICGIYPILLLLELTDSKDRKLLSYYRSSDIFNTARDSAVSYASIVFKR